LTRWTAAILLAGTVLRFAFALHAGELSPDEKYRYTEIARHLRAGEGFAIAGHPTAQAMPLWPFLLAALPPGLDPHLVSALLSSLCLPLLWLLARRLATPAAAGLALAFLAVDLDQASLGGSLLTEPLFTLLLLGFALAWTARRTVVAALVLGLATLARPEAFLIPLAMALWTREWRRPALLLGGVVLAVAPWATRNALRFDAFVPFTTTGGITLNAGMNETEEDLPFRKKGQGRNKHFRHALVMARERTEIVDDRELARQAVAYAADRPGQALVITAAKVVGTWTPLQRKGRSFMYAIATLLGWWALVKRVRFPEPLVAPMLTVMTFVCVVFLAIPRYHAPYHPYLFLAGAAALCGVRPVSAS